VPSRDRTEEMAKIIQCGALECERCWRRGDCHEKFCHSKAQKAHKMQQNRQQL
jgi:hypothetical protein